MRETIQRVRILSVLVFFCVLWFSPPHAVAEDLEEVRRMAEHGSRPFQLRLWEVYSRGEGVVRDEQQAMRWLTTAAEGGYGPAQNVLGVYTLEHARYRSDIDRARQWLEKAAANRQAEAQYRLGLLYLEGAPGLRADIEKLCTGCRWRQTQAMAMPCMPWAGYTNRGAALRWTGSSRLNFSQQLPGKITLVPCTRWVASRWSRTPQMPQCMPWTGFGALPIRERRMP